ADLSAHLLEKEREQRRGADAVHVIVAVEADGLAVSECPENPGDGVLRPLEKRGIRQVREAGAQKGRGRFGVTVAPLDEETPDQRVQRERVREATTGLLRTLCDDPLGLHLALLPNARRGAWRLSRGTLPRPSDTAPATDEEGPGEPDPSLKPPGQAAAR